jgi:hypothetical protein
VSPKSPYNNVSEDIVRKRRIIDGYPEAIDAPWLGSWGQGEGGAERLIPCD